MMELAHCNHEQCVFVSSPTTFKFFHREGEMHASCHINVGSAPSPTAASNLLIQLVVSSSAGDLRTGRSVILGLFSQTQGLIGITFR
jgi:hypothetical protein